MKRLLLGIAIVLFVSNYVFAAFGYFGTAANIETTLAPGTGFYNMTPLAGDPNAIGANNYQGTDFGCHTMNSGTLKLLGGEIKTWKDGGSNVCGGTLFYTVYLSGMRPASPIFNNINISFLENCAGGSFPSGGPCGGNDQKWQSLGANIDLTTYAPGNYTLEIYYSIEGNNSNSSACGEFVFDNNGGAADNYTATFKIDAITPVRYKFVEAQNRDDYNLISWSTTSEVNSDYFSVEKSTNLKDWKEIAQISAAGNSSTDQYYSTKDYEIQNTQWYRLVQYDFDRSFSFSEIVFVQNELHRSALPFPNPVYDELFISNFEEIKSYELRTLQGQLIIKGVRLERIGMTELEQGYFLLILENKLGQRQTHKILKI